MIPAHISVWVALLLALSLLPVSVSAAPPSLSEADTLFAAGKFDGARTAYLAAEKADPDTAAPRLGLVRTLLRLDNWPDALTEAQAAAQKFPANADTHGLLALALIRAGWQEPYASEAAQSLSLDPKNYWGLLASGRAAEWDGSYAEAQKDFRQASEAHPELPEAWARRFLMEDEARTAAEAVRIAGVYLKLNPHGHPHDEIAEDARDLSRHAGAYQAAFGADTPYRHTDAPPAAAGAAKSAGLAVDFLGDYAVFPVTINGKPFRLLFDTGGGDDILLFWNAAKRLGLSPIAHTLVRGVGGKEKSDILKADTLTIAGNGYRSIQILTAGGMETKMDGILGGNILADSVVTLDFEARTAQFTQGIGAEAPPLLPGDSRVTLPFHFYHGNLFVQMAVNTRPVWALLDTGAYETTLSLRLAREMLKTVPKEDVHSGSYRGRRGIGTSDGKMEYLASRDESQIRLSETPPVYIPMDTLGTSDLDRAVSPDSGCDFEIGLWIGMGSFTYARRLTFDYPRRLLTFEYRDPDAASPAAAKPGTGTEAGKK